MNRLIPQEHLQLVCKIGQGKGCCRYVLGGPEGIECGKGGELSAAIDERVVRNEMVAQGDNCNGIYRVPLEGGTG